MMTNNKHDWRIQAGQSRLFIDVPSGAGERSIVIRNGDSMMEIDAGNGKLELMPAPISEIARIKDVLGRNNTGCFDQSPSSVTYRVLLPTSVTGPFLHGAFVTVENSSKELTLKTTRFNLSNFRYNCGSWTIQPPFVPALLKRVDDFYKKFVELTGIELSDFAEVNEDMTSYSSILAKCKELEEFHSGDDCWIDFENIVYPNKSEMTHDNTWYGWRFTLNPFDKDELTYANIQKSTPDLGWEPGGVPEHLRQACLDDLNKFIDKLSDKLGYKFAKMTMKDVCPELQEVS